MQEMMEGQSELPKLRWVAQSAFSKNLKARDEWRTKSGTLASGKIRYTIQFGAVSVHWRIFLQGEQSSFAQGRGLSEQEAKDAIEAWRNDHLEMPIWKASQSEIESDGK